METFWSKAGLRHGRTDRKDYATYYELPELRLDPVHPLEVGWQVYNYTVQVTSRIGESHVEARPYTQFLKTGKNYRYFSYKD